MNQKYFQIAKKISYNSNCSRVKIGAVIVKNKKIIATSCNQNKTHPIQAKLNKLRENDHKKNCSYLHAELAAIIKSKINLQNAIIYIFRENKNGQLGICYPCPACLHAIKKSGIKAICYTNTDGFHYINVKKACDHLRQVI